jgi:hypothetical protein
MAIKTTPIPQDEIKESFVWRDWFQRLSNRVYGTMAEQDASAVAVTGGVIQATSVTTDTLYVPTGTDGQVLIGKTSDHSFAPATLTAGTNITITNAPGSITIAASGGSGSGDVDCSNCSGSGEVDCSNCEGDGKVECDVCDGDGVDSDGDTCYDCEGDGEVKCSNCYGRGSKTCFNCGGDGNLECEIELIEVKKFDEMLEEYAVCELTDEEINLLEKEVAIKFFNTLH